MNIEKMREIETARHNNESEIVGTVRGILNLHHQGYNVFGDLAKETIERLESLVKRNMELFDEFEKAFNEEA